VRYGKGLQNIWAAPFPFTFLTLRHVSTPQLYLRFSTLRWIFGELTLVVKSKVDNVCSSKMLSNAENACVNRMWLLYFVSRYRDGNLRLSFFSDSRTKGFRRKNFLEPLKAGLPHIFYTYSQTRTFRTLQDCYLFAKKGVCCIVANWDQKDPKILEFIIILTIITVLFTIASFFEELALFEVRKQCAFQNCRKCMWERDVSMRLLIQRGFYFVFHI